MKECREAFDHSLIASGFVFCEHEIARREKEKEKNNIHFFHRTTEVSPSSSSSNHQRSSEQQHHGARVCKEEGSRGKECREDRVTHLTACVYRAEDSLSPCSWPQKARERLTNVFDTQLAKTIRQGKTTLEGLCSKRQPLHERSRSVSIEMRYVPR